MAERSKSDSRTSNGEPRLGGGTSDGYAPLSVFVRRREEVLDERERVRVGGTRLPALSSASLLKLGLSPVPSPLPVPLKEGANRATCGAGLGDEVVRC